MYTPEEFTRPLSDQGRIAAKQLVDAFSEIEISAMYASEYARAIETIQPIADEKKLGIDLFAALNERKLSSTSVDNFDRAIAKVWQNPTFQFPGGESNIVAQKRAIPIIEELIEKHTKESIIIGSHGNILTLILNHYELKYDIDFWNSLKMPDVIKADFSQNKLIAVNRFLVETKKQTKAD